MLSQAQGSTSSGSCFIEQVSCSHLQPTCQAALNIILLADCYQPSACRAGKEDIVQSLLAETLKIHVAFPVASGNG